MASKPFLLWLADNCHRVDPTTWRLLALTEPQSTVLDVFSLNDMPISENGTLNRKRKRVIESPEPELHPFDVGKNFLVDVEGEELAICKLVEFDTDGDHVVQWFYTPDQAQHMDLSVADDLIDRVLVIDGTPLMESNHQQVLPYGPHWVDVSEKMSAVVPLTPLRNIDYYVVGFLDVDRKKVIETDSSEDMIASLLSIGRDGGKYLNRNLRKFTNFRRIPKHQGVCDACKLKRTLSCAFDCGNRTLKVGKTCFARIDLAHKVDAEDDVDKRKEMLAVIDIPGWTR